MTTVQQQQAVDKPKISWLKVLLVVAVNIAVIATAVLLGWVIYFNVYGWGLVCLIIALVLLVPLALAVDVWAISVLLVYVRRNGDRIIKGTIPSPTGLSIEEIQNVQRLIKPMQAMSRLDMSSGKDTMSSKMSSDVQSSEDEIEVTVLIPMEQSIYDNERKKQSGEVHKTDEQLAQRWNVSSKTIQRTRNAMKQSNKL